MEFIRLNKGWNAAPNAPWPRITIVGQNLLLSFKMNHFLYNEYTQDDIGILEFQNCVQFRMGATNHDEFFRYGDRYKEHGVAWGHFYRVLGSGWREHFDDSVHIRNEPYPEELQHYLFYFRDQDFECIAAGHEFRVNRKRP